MKKQLILACSLIVSATISAQSISKELLQKMQTENQMTPSDRAIRNALSVTDLKSLALSQDVNTIRKVSSCPLETLSISSSSLVGFSLVSS